jgi:hypothetical protein
MVKKQLTPRIFATSVRLWNNFKKLSMRSAFCFNEPFPKSAQRPAEVHQNHRQSGRLFRSHSWLWHENSPVLDCLGGAGFRAADGLLGTRRGESKPLVLICLLAALTAGCGAKGASLTNEQIRNQVGYLVDHSNGTNLTLRNVQWCVEGLSKNEWECKVNLLNHATGNLWETTWWAKCEDRCRLERQD